MVYKSLIKSLPVLLLQRAYKSAIKSKIMPNQQLTEESQLLENLKKSKSILMF